MSNEFYSHGAHSNVWRVGESDKKNFPHADLLRQEKQGDSFWYARLFYMHKIASLLFPGNFIDVVGVTRDFQDQIDDGSTESNMKLPKHTVTLFSKEARVPADHATFSSDCIVSEGEKVNKCGCVKCLRHKDFHNSESLFLRAKRFSRRVQQVGITVPYKDPSDYCLDRHTNKIVFFEIEGFKPPLVAQYLESSPDTTPSERRAQNLLLRYNELVAQSRKHLISGSGVREMRI